MAASLVPWGSLEFLITLALSIVSLAVFELIADGLPDWVEDVRNHITHGRSFSHHRIFDEFSAPFVVLGICATALHHFIVFRNLEYLACAACCFATSLALLMTSVGFSTTLAVGGGQQRLSGIRIAKFGANFGARMLWVLLMAFLLGEHIAR